jgi:hypothetical protein
MSIQRVSQKAKNLNLAAPAIAQSNAGGHENMEMLGKWMEGSTRRI